MAFAHALRVRLHPTHEPQPREALPADAPASHPTWRRWVGVALVVVAAVGVGTLYQRSVAARTLPDGLLQLNGRIEGDDVTIGSKVPGRVQALLAREGDAVRAGQTVAVLEDGAARARLAQAVAWRDVAMARVEVSRAELVLLRKQVPITVASADAALRASEATLEQQRAEEAQAVREQTRVTRLVDSGSLDPQSGERAVLSRDAAAQGVLAARASRDKAAAALHEAQLGPDQIRSKEAEIVALDAAAKQAQAVVDEAQNTLDDLTIKAPVEGTVTTRFVDVGQVLSAGTPVLQIVDLDKLYLKAFVPDSDVGKIHLGSMGRVFTDAFPAAPAAATVRYVASRAEFTPKEVQTRDERVKLVYTVKLYIDDNHDRRMVPGLGADAIVRWREDAPWTTPR